MSLEKRIIPLEAAFDIVCSIPDTFNLSKREESLLELLLLSCTQIQDGSGTYLYFDELQAFSQNYIKAIREKDSTFLYRQRGLKGPLVDMEEFLESSEYMGQKGFVRPLVKYELEQIFSNPNYIEVVLSGSTGWGKSYTSRMVVARMLYQLSMLWNPQAEYDLSPGSLIIFPLQSVTTGLSKKVLFDPLHAEIASSRYFREHFQFDKRIASELKFPHQINVIPISGSEMATLGLNVYGGIISEANYFSVVENSKLLKAQGAESQVFDQAERSYTNIIQRMKNRFQDRGKVPGLMVLDSAVHYPGDFLSRKKEAARFDPSIYVAEHAIWEVISKDKLTPGTFLVEVGDASRSSRIIANENMASPDARVIEVPVDYLRDFERDIEFALRDFAGIVTGHRHAFMPYRDSITEATKTYAEVYHGNSLFNIESCVISDLFVGAPRWEEIINQDYIDDLSFDSTAEFSVHLDIGISRDATGLAVGHIQTYKELPSSTYYSQAAGDFIEMLDVKAPVFCIDGMLQIRPPASGEVDLDLLKGLCIFLTRKLNLKFATLDRFESASFLQSFQKLKVRSGQVSVVATPVPYMELKGSYIEGRIIHQNHEVYMNEIVNLEFDPKKQKIDHNPHSCFTGDTRVALLDGTNPTFKELSRRYPNGEPFNVFSMSEDGIVVGSAHHPRLARRDAELYEITLDNFQVIRCTPDHLFMTTSSEWIEARNLTSAISIMPLYRNINTTGGWAGYPLVYDPVKDVTFFIHRLMSELQNGPANDDHAVHHKDGNKLNNEPSNLEVVSKADHARYHTKERHKSDEIWVKSLRDGHRNYVETEGREKSRDNILKLFAEGKLKRGRDKCKEDGCNLLVNARGYCDKHYQYHKRRGDLGELCRVPECSTYAESQGLCLKHLESGGIACIVDGCDHPAFSDSLCLYHHRLSNEGRLHRHKTHKNHRVLSVKKLDYVEDVWDLTVDDYHNFALTAGVFVHNSKDVADCVAAVVHILQHKVARYTKKRVSDTQTGEVRSLVVGKKVPFRFGGR